MLFVLVKKGGKWEASPRSFVRPDAAESYAATLRDIVERDKRDGLPLAFTAVRIVEAKNSVAAEGHANTYQPQGESA